VLIGGTACALVVATVAITWALSTEGSAPVGSIVLIWTAVAIGVASWSFGIMSARRAVVDRLRATNRMQLQIDELGNLASRTDQVGQQLSEITEAVAEINSTVNGSAAFGDIAHEVRDVERRLESRIEDNSRLLARRLDRLEPIRAVVDPSATVHRSPARERPRHVFVLGTGRCGTMTFSAACTHFDNFTAAHESRTRLLGAERFDYPDHHIEVDNRLSWFLGELDRRFDDDETFYVHLTRSSDEVVESYARRWDSGFRSSIGRAFGYGIVIRGREWPPEDVESVLRFYVDTVTSNVDSFLRGRNGMTIALERLDEQFESFADRIGATGDLGAAHRELDVRHNASTTTSPPPSQSM